MLTLAPCMLVLRARAASIGGSIFITNTRGMEQGLTLREAQATRATRLKMRALQAKGLLRSGTSRPTSFGGTGIWDALVCIGQERPHLGGCQPPGEAAKIPFPADVRADAQQHVQAQVLRDIEEALHIRLTLKGELARRPLMEVPGRVELQAHSDIRKARLKGHPPLRDVGGVLYCVPCPCIHLAMTLLMETQWRLASVGTQCCQCTDELRFAGCPLMLA